MAMGKAWFMVLEFGVIAQLVERLNGIEEVWGSNPHGSKRAWSHESHIAGGDSWIPRGQV